MRQVNIKALVAQGIIGAVTGCRVNGGGCNRAMLNTKRGRYIVGNNEVLKYVGTEDVTVDTASYYNQSGDVISVWQRMELTTDDDIAFCRKLDSNEGYDYCSWKGFSVIGCSMPQIHLKIQEEPTPHEDFLAKHRV